MGGSERGAALSAARSRMVMTQESLAEAAGVSVPTVKRAEAGRPVQAETLRALCAVLGLDCRDLADAMAGECGIPAPSCASDAAAQGPVADAAVGTGPAASPPASIGPRRRSVLRRARDLATLTNVVLCLPIVIEAFAWVGPFSDTPLGFRFVQIHAAKATAFALLYLSLVELWSTRRNWRSFAWAGVLGMALAFAAADGCLAFVQEPRFDADMSGLATAMNDDLSVWRGYRKLVDRMVADEPGYDRSVDDFYLMRHVEALGHVVDLRWGTPGELRAAKEAERRCHADWETAATYDRARCEARGTRIAPFSRWDQVVRALTGGPFDDRTVQAEVAKHFADKRYDRARAEAAASVDEPGPKVADVSLRWGTGER